MSEAIDAPKQFFDPDGNKPEASSKTFKQKAIEKINKLFKRKNRAPLELKIVDVPKIPVESGLGKLIGEMKTGIIKTGMSEMQKQEALRQSQEAAKVIEQNYFRFLRDIEGINDVTVQDEVKSALNNGDMRTIAALSQMEYRNVMSQMVEKAESLEKEIQNKKLNEKAAELLKIRSQAALMGVDMTGVYQDTERRPFQYWGNVLNPKEAKQAEEPVMINRKVDQDLEEALAASIKSDQPLDEGKKEE